MFAGIPEVSHIFMLLGSVVSKTRVDGLHSVLILKTSQDLKLVRTSGEDVLLHQSAAVKWLVLPCFLVCFHLNPL